MYWAQLSPVATCGPPGNRRRVEEGFEWAGAAGAMSGPTGLVCVCVDAGALWSTGPSRQDPLAVLTDMPLLLIAFAVVSFSALTPPLSLIFEAD